MQPATAGERPSARRLNRDVRPEVEIPDDLGKLVERDAALVRELGWEGMVAARRGRGDLTDMRGFTHPARRLLRLYGSKGVPVKLKGGDWD